MKVSNARILFRIQILWILTFNTFLFTSLVFGIAELFIKSRTLGYLTIGLFVLIMLLITFLEFALRRFNNKNNKIETLDSQSPHRKMLEYVLKKIPNSPFNVDEFLKEMDDYYKQGLTRRVDRTRTSTDYNGTYIKITEGIRNGIRPLSNFENKIYVFGGSTVSCLEGPDEWTLPSQIQDQLNRNQICKRVINLGVSGATTFDRFIAASDQKSIRHGDTLFFWFGANEGKGLWGRRGIGFLGFWPGFVELFALVRKRSKSIIIDWLYLELVKFDEKSHRRLARIRAAELRKSFDEQFKKWADADVKVIAGLQPTIFSASSNAAAHKFLAKNWKPEMMTIMNIQYEEFRLAFKEANYFYDFSDSTNEEPENSFVDWVHLSWYGNHIAAEKICNTRIFFVN